MPLPVFTPPSHRQAFTPSSSLLGLGLHCPMVCSVLEATAPQDAPPVSSRISCDGSHSVYAPASCASMTKRLSLRVCYKACLCFNSHITYWLAGWTRQWTADLRSALLPGYCMPHPCPHIQSLQHVGLPHPHQLQCLHLPLSKLSCL